MWIKKKQPPPPTSPQYQHYKQENTVSNQQLVEVAQKQAGVGGRNRN